MAKPIFQITPGAQTTATYLDYSSCFSTKKGKLKFDEGDFKSVVKDKTNDKDNITASELKSIFTGLTDEQAAYLIKTADTKGGKRGVKNDKLDWEELQVAIKSADVAGSTAFDGIVSFENFQKLVTDPAVKPIAETKPTGDGDDTLKPAAKEDDKAITKNEPAAHAADTNESFFSLNHSEEGGAGLGGGNGALLAFGGLALLLLCLGGSRRC
jgi:hypothetical protein